MAINPGIKNARDAVAFAAAVAGISIALVGCSAKTSSAEPATGSPQTLSSDSSSTSNTSSTKKTAPATAAAASAGAGHWCTRKDLSITTETRPSPEPADRLFVINLAGRDGANCVIGGALSNVAFFTQDGATADVSIGGGQDPNYTETTVTGDRAAVAYVREHHDSNTTTPATKMTFQLPGKGVAGDTVTVSWPGPVQGTLQFSNVQAPVS